MAIESLTELWEKICEDCNQNNRISTVGLEAWILDLVPMSTDNGVLTLRTNNEYKKKTIDSFYKKILEQSCEAVSGLPMKVEITVLSEEKKETSSTETEERYTFENFIVGSSNKFAHASAMQVSQNPSANLYNPLFIYGNSGVGKTHLMHAIKNRIERQFPEKKVIFLRGEQFQNELVQAILNKTTDIFHERFRSADVLLIDDIHFIAGKEQAQEEFYNTFDALYPKKQIVVSSDRPPKEIKTLEERIRSRFESGVLADMSPPDFETRVCILKNKATELGLEISDDILYYIAEQIKNNIRQLEGIIKKLQAYVSILSNNLTLPLVQKYIRDVVIETMPEPITIDKIVEEVSRTYNISVDDIYSNSRTADVALARQVSMYIIREVMKISTPEIGKKFNKDHTSVIHNINKIKSLIKNNENEKKIIDDIIKNVNS